MEVNTVYFGSKEIKMKRQKVQEGRDYLMWFIVAFLFPVVLFFGACRGIFASEDKAIQTLHSQGYSDIEIVDKAWFLVGVRGCGEGDAARFTAKVTNPAGKRAEVYVCTGLAFKGGTIRGE